MSQIGTDPVARRLFQGNEAEDDLRYKRIVEPYVIDNLPSGDINSAVFTEAHFPAKGSPHPDVEEAVLVSRRLVGRINQNQCLYLLTYRSNLPFGAAFRGASSSTNATRQITAPRWQQYTIDIGGASSGLRFSLQGESLERVFATQSFTVEITGLTALQVQALSAPFQNRAFPIASTWWIYRGVSARSLSSGRVLATHRFRTSGAVRAVAETDLGAGRVLRPLPALAPLDEYGVVDATPGTFPQTVVRPRSELYTEESTIDVLPGLPL